MRMILKRKFENNDVAAAYFAIRENMVVPMSAPAENKFVHEQVIADEQSRLHGLRRNLEGLNDKRGAEQRQDHRNQKRFDVFPHRGGMRFRAIGRGGFARSDGLCGFRSHFVPQFSSAPNCIRAAMAADCSASFFVFPHPTALTCPAMRTSTRNVFW